MNPHEDLKAEIKASVDAQVRMLRTNLKKAQEGMAEQGRQLATLAGRLEALESGTPSLAGCEEEPESLRWLDGEPYCPPLARRIAEALELPTDHAEGLTGLVERLLAEHERERELADMAADAHSDSQAAWWQAQTERVVKRCDALRTAMAGGPTKVLDDVVLEQHAAAVQRSRRIESERDALAEEVDTLRARLAEVVDSLTALVQPRELWQDAGCCRCGSPVKPGEHLCHACTGPTCERCGGERGTGYEFCSSCTQAQQVAQP